MKIAQKYSHLNGEEYLIVHHNNLYDEIKTVIYSINATTAKTKISQEKIKQGKTLLSPIELNKQFEKHFNKLFWTETRYQYCVTTDRDILPKLIHISVDEQKKLLAAEGNTNPIQSYKQTDFVKNKIAVEVQFGKYAFVAFDLFVKHMLFYTGGVINVGVEILPTKQMQSQMSSGIAYFEGEVYNIIRQGRNSPPVPLLILGIEE